MFKEASAFLPTFDMVIDLIENDVGCTYQLGVNICNDGKLRGRVLEFVDKTDPRRDQTRAQTLAAIAVYRKWQSGQYPLKGRYVGDGLIISDNSGNVVAELPPPYVCVPS